NVSRTRGPKMEETEWSALPVRGGKTGFPGRHVPLPAAPHRGESRIQIAAVDPELVREVRGAHIRLALAILAVAGGAVVGKDFLAGPGLVRGRIAGAGVRETSHIGDDVLDVSAGKHAVAAEGEHLRASAVGVGGVDPDPDRLGDRLRRAAPQPGSGRQVGKSLAALGVAPMTDGALVAEERAAGLADDRHQLGVALDFGKVRLLDAGHPGGTI